MITEAQIIRIMPRAKRADIQKYLPFFNELFPQYEVNTPLRLRHFFAQIAVESGNLSRIEENLNYSAARLMAVWPRRFTLAKAVQYAHKPFQIASYVYGGRFGNGPESTGDGYKFRGRGLKQVTFHDNYQNCSRALFKDDRLVINPDLLLEPRNAVLSALWFWDANRLNKLADRGTVREVTRVVNGGSNGLSAREAVFRDSSNVFV